MYDPAFCRELLQYASKEPGACMVGFAASILVHRDTLYEWAKKHSEFSDTLRLAKEIMHAKTMLVVSSLNPMIFFSRV